MIELIGHLHPLLVHLPIGMLMVGLLLQWLSQKEKYASIKPAVPIVLLWGSITAFISCITGYFLSISDDYNKSLVNWHMWMAIGVVLASAVLYTKEKNPAVEVPKKIVSFGLLVLLIVTGHLGSALTHGSDYLTKPFLKILGHDTTAKTIFKPLEHIHETFTYNNTAKPGLQSKCYSSYTTYKQKGGIRMNDVALLIKGGKHGK